MQKCSVDGGLRMFFEKMLSVNRHFANCQSAKGPLL